MKVTNTFNHINMINVILLKWAKRLAVVLLMCIFSNTVFGQINYGTTGLINMPTADMQQDKTFMATGMWLNHHATVPRWWYDTWNYSVNITIFPWLEIGYLCIGHKAVPVDYGNYAGYWVPSTYGKFVNQDRSFHGRLRLWKEGWWKAWTPQVVVGFNDGVNQMSASVATEVAYSTNAFLNRYFLAVTKHFDFLNIGILGAHLTWIYSTRKDNELNDPALGVNFRFTLPATTWWRKAINGFNIMSEVLPGYTDVRENLTFDPDGPKYQANIGLTYNALTAFSPKATKRFEVEAVLELNRCRYVSAGVLMKVHLK